MKKLAVVLVAVLAITGATVVIAGPADARRDSGWGCGGACRIPR
jgi:hypothetical protein